MFLLYVKLTFEFGIIQKYAKSIENRIEEEVFIDTYRKSCSFCRVCLVLSSSNPTSGGATIGKILI